ncbi:MAG: phosphatase PAP2 family protein [Anaerolineae bacterium]|nr:phosphatase PAP2 family protein [Anaerolineae bacterium]
MNTNTPNTQHSRNILYRLPLVQKLGLRLIVGLLVTIACSWLFYSIAEDVVEKDRLVAFDIATANALHAAATPTSTAVFEFISWLGLPGIWFVGMFLGVYFVSKNERLNLAALVFALIGGLILNSTLKLLFARDRPVFIDPLVIEQNFSFPSGHAMLSLIGYGFLTYFLLKGLRNQIARILLSVAMILLVILIGTSRVTLGVHYLSDVIAGFAAGTVWLMSCFIALNGIYRRRRRKSAPTSAATVS